MCIFILCDIFVHSGGCLNPAYVLSCLIVSVKYKYRYVHAYTKVIANRLNEIAISFNMPTVIRNTCFTHRRQHNYVMMGQEAEVNFVFDS